MSLDTMQVFKSQILSWSAGSELPFPTQFLDPARKMRAPCVDNITLLIKGTVNTSMGGGPSKQFPAVAASVLLTDAAGIRFKVRGSSLRLINQIEVPGYFDGANIAASQTAATFTRLMYLPMQPRKARRRQDYRMPLREFLDGGDLRITCSGATVGAGATALTVTAGTFQWFFDVIDEGTPELKSRLTYLDYPIQLADAMYPVSGSLRTLVAYAGDVAEFAGTVWPAQNISSRTFDYSGLPDTYLRLGRNMSEHFPRVADPAGAIATEDCVAAGYAIPLKMPDWDQGTVELPDLITAHYFTDGTITTANAPQMVVGSITDRSADVSARTLGVRSGTDAGQLIGSHGKVNLADGRAAHVSKTAASPAGLALAKRMPVHTK